MNFVALPRRALLACSLVLWGVGAAAAQENSFCSEPGLNLLTDTAGDVDFQFLPAGLPLDPLDVQSLHVAQPAQADGIARVVFTLKVAALTQLVPRQAWFASFESADKRTHAVRMAVGEDGVAVFQSYLVLVDVDGNVTEGRYPETGSVKPAEPESSFNADGTIRIVVKAEAIGLRRTDGVLSGFNAASLQQIPTGDTLTPSGDLLALVGDGMPDDMSRSGEVAVSISGECPVAAKAELSRFGGALGAGTLLLLPLFAALRRWQGS